MPLPDRANQDKDDVSGLRLLGGGSLPRVSSGPSASLLEAFPNRYPHRPYVVSISFPEFTSLCPVTGQPDFGTISVEYVPDQWCVESKSFKLYMFAFRNHQSFMESITNTVLEDLVGVLCPAWCRVKGLFAPRGGTRIHVFAEEFKALPPEQDAAVRALVAAWRSEADPHRA
ncbi:preQ(1) synthase [Desulfovibrio sp.]|uniref:preQ(1) synthase n=1 Tax=Desulfovibrio sp. TaxID=885 RepID=UPI0023CCAD4D|nr:preQ(1) synthase [Desulfovibrio sp.]MDE7240844.1 preQ(1) synthase [Desulfovibrio sp.]